MKDHRLNQLSTTTFCAHQYYDDYATHSTQNNHAREITNFSSNKLQISRNTRYNRYILQTVPKIESWCKFS